MGCVSTVLESGWGERYRELRELREQRERVQDLKSGEGDGRTGCRVRFVQTSTPKKE